MGKFNKTGKREMPALNTSSLPDLIFTLLFFFMIVTTMREVTLKVQFTLPAFVQIGRIKTNHNFHLMLFGKLIKRVIDGFFVSARITEQATASLVGTASRNTMIVQFFSKYQTGFMVKPHMGQGIQGLGISTLLIRP